MDWPLLLLVLLAILLSHTVIDAQTANRIPTSRNTSSVLKLDDDDPLQLVLLPTFIFLFFTYLL